MMKMTHLIEPVGLGGVSRNLDTLMACLTGIEHTRLEVTPRTSLPPVIPADHIVVMHFTTSWSKLPYLAALRGMRGSAPIVLVEHSYTAAYETLMVGSKTRFRAMLRVLYRFVDRVVAVSHGQAEWLAASGVVEARKIITIPSSTELTAFYKVPLPQRRGNSGLPVRIGSCGRFCEQKGYGNLIQALRSVPPGVATLTLAGDGPYGHRLRSLAAENPDIRICGPTADVPALMADCDVVSMPSRFESFGQVALEGRAAGRPLIASAVDGLVEQTRPEWGWLVPVDDVAALSAAIIAAANADLTAMGAAARRSAEGHLEASMDAWRGLAERLTHAAARGHQAASAA